MTQRVAVPLPKSYLLLNHGPTVLVSSAHGGQRNVMAAAWNMALDFDPPKVAVVIDKSTLTRELVEASGEFVLNVPAREQAAQRVANLTGPTTEPRLNADYFLTAATVHDDQQSDLVAGAGGRDWFFANLDQPAKDWTDADLKILKENVTDID